MPDLEPAVLFLQHAEGCSGGNLFERLTVGVLAEIQVQNGPDGGIQRVNSGVKFRFLRREHGTVGIKGDYPQTVMASGRQPPRFILIGSRRREPFQKLPFTVAPFLDLVMRSAALLP